jgi:hypothetical protein
MAADNAMTGSSPDEKSPGVSATPQPPEAAPPGDNSAGKAGASSGKNTSSDPSAGGQTNPQGRTGGNG